MKKVYKIKSIVAINNLDYCGYQFTKKWSEPIEEGEVGFNAVLVSKPFFEKEKEPVKCGKRQPVREFENNYRQSKKQTKKKKEDFSFDTNTSIEEEKDTSDSEKKEIEANEGGNENAE